MADFIPNKDHFALCSGTKTADLYIILQNLIKLEK